MRNFKEWCIDNNREEILTYWDYDKNTLQPSEVPPRCLEKVYWKCPACGLSWQNTPYSEANLTQTPFRCRNCKKPNQSSFSKKNDSEMPARIKRLGRPKQVNGCSLTIDNFVSNAHKIGIIDVETTFSDEVMSVGIVIVDTEKNYDFVDARYWLIDPYYQSPGMFAHMLHLSDCNPPFIYKEAQVFVDSIQEKITSMDTCLEELRQLMGIHNCQILFAYNAHFDKRHLLELSDYIWVDMISVMANCTLNTNIDEDVITDSLLSDQYTDHWKDRKGNWFCKGYGGDTFQYSIDDLISPTGKLRKGYKFAYIFRCFPGCSTYQETHNGLFDAIDEATALKYLGLPVSVFYSAITKDTKNEQAKRVLLKKKIEAQKIPFIDTLDMSYQEYANYLIDKYGPAKGDYFQIIRKGDRRYEEIADCYAIKRKNNVLVGRKKYPIIDGHYTVSAGDQHSIFDAFTYWYYEKDELYICWAKKGNYSKTYDGLLCHHIDENKAELLSTPEFASLHPITYQSADRLVYCDYIEHFLLHHKYGSEGAKLIASTIKSLLLQNAVEDWQKPCLERLLHRSEDLKYLIRQGIIFNDL